MKIVNLYTLTGTDKDPAKSLPIGVPESYFMLSRSGHPGSGTVGKIPGAGRPLLPLIRVRVVVMMVAMVPPVLLPFFLRIPMVISPMVIVALVPFGRMLPLVISHPLPFFRRIPAVIIPMIPVLPIPFARMLLLAHSNPVRAY